MIKVEKLDKGLKTNDKLHDHSLMADPQVGRNTPLNRRPSLTQGPPSKRARSEENDKGLVDGSGVQEI